ncbi:hypothetical protein F5Y10DRAFT_281086 [Nemania abortiva]|nr:hypothetical protein F5Y10DRAFT_281086 [Nemania abortiva]
MSAAQCVLFANFLWELSERRIAKKYIDQYKPFPLPSPKERLYDSSDPKQLIFVTINSELGRTEGFVKSAAIRNANLGTEIIVTALPHANKREQLVKGVEHSTGKIIAFVDDDGFWKPSTLLHLLAPFQEADIGLVGGPVESYIPEERQNPSTITVWETAALRNRSKRRGGNKAFYMADGSTNFTVSGATMLLRAEIVKDREFQHEFMQETFLGVRQNTGDDSFITRWVLFQHLRAGRENMRWRLGIQITPEASVSTTLKRDKSFVDQMKRWLRTGLRFRLTCLFVDPGLRAFRRETPYMARKMVEGMFNPLLTLIWYVAFFQTLRHQPLVALLFAAYYLYGLVTSMAAFAREFPYCREKIWAAVLSDRVSLVSDWYCWSTLLVENWSSRAGVDSRGQR